MPSITLPDGSVRSYDKPVTPADVAADIGPGLAKAAFVAKIDGKLVDLDHPMSEDAALALITRKDDAALEHIRHDCAHVLAEAVLELYPETQVTIGPSIENGFYYDFNRAEPFSTDDLAAIEQRMHEIVDRDERIVREEWTREQAIAHYKQTNEPFKVELAQAIPEGEIISFYRQGNFLDLCRGPHGPSTKAIGVCFARQVVAAVPREPHDHRVDRVVTESGPLQPIDPPHR